MFFAAMLIVGLSCIAITYKTLVGYGEFSVWLKLSVLILLAIAWFSPLLLRVIRHSGVLSGGSYAAFSNLSYFLMGYAFILIVLLLARDIIWYVVYFISHNPAFNPNNVLVLHRLNLWALGLAMALALYGVYEALKVPEVKEIEITDNRIKEDTRIVVASDLHIDRASWLAQVRQFVDKVNDLKPDYVLLVGDVVDDIPSALEQDMAELQKIKAKRVFVAFGNHEYYVKPILWLSKFNQMGFEVLHNAGYHYDDLGIYIGGVPDIQSGAVNFEKAAHGASEDVYKILMSHSPMTAQQLRKGQFDLQVSGHTHGGQIFPFNFLVQAFNGFLAGMYEVNGNKLYVSRGVGYWGPSLRLLAPSDITVLNLKKVPDEQ